MAEGSGKKTVGKIDYPPKPSAADKEAEKEIGKDVGEAFPISDILAKSKESEIGTVAETAPTTVMANALANAKPLKEREKNGNGNGKKEGVRTEAPKAGAEVIPPELEHLKQEERDLYLKLPETKKESYLAHIAEARARVEKKEKKKQRKVEKVATAPKDVPMAETKKAETVIYNPGQFVDVGIPESIAQKDATQEAERIPIIANPEEAIDQEHIQEILGGKESMTPRESRTLLSKLIDGYKQTLEGAKESVGAMSERGERLKTYFMERSKELGEKAKVYGPKAVELIGSMSEKYNKLNWKSKLAIAGILIAGVSLTSTTLPIASAMLSGMLYGQRVVGGIGFAMNRRKALDAKIAANPDHWLAGKSERVKNTYATALAAVYMGGTAFAVHEGVEALNALGVNEWLGNMLGHHPAASEVVPASRPITGLPHAPEISQMPAAAAAGEAAAQASVPEVPAVMIHAQSGRGYEFMAKQLWEQLHSQDIDASKFDAGGDIHKLLTATPETINEVVHRIASDPQHGFFNPDGTSAIIRPTDVLTIGANGQVLLMTPDDVIAHAPVGGPTTPSYHPEMSSTVERLPLSPDGIVPPDTSAAALEDQDLGTSVETPEAGSPEDAPPLQEVKLVSPESITTVDLTGAQDLAETPATSETLPSAPTIEHMEEFINQNKLPIDPLQGHVFQDKSGALLAYGNDFGARFDAAQEFARANPNTSVWVQAEKPVFYEGAWRPWVFEVKYGGWWRGMQILGADGPTVPSQIGGIDPNTFIKQLDK